MAKIRVAQIKDLSLTVPTTDNGFATLEVGTTTKDVLTSIVQGDPAEGTTQSGIMTGITVSGGNTITPEYKSLSELNLYSKTEVDTAITTAINGLDATVANINALTNGTTTDDIRVEVVETDGKITAVNVTDTLKSIAHSGLASDVTVTPNGNLSSTNVQAALAELQGDIDAINSQTITALPNQAVQVSPAENGNVTIGLELNEETGKAILSQTADGLKTTLTVDTKKYPDESTAEGYVAEKAGKTYIQIKGVGGNVVSETDASAFVKDGFLQSVTKDATTNELIFTWNIDAGDGEENQVTRIAISDLCDVYTAKANDWILLNGYEFSHKLSTVIPTAGEGEEQATSKTVGSATATGVAAAGETVTFNVPSITVDRAGHVTSASETEVTVALPNFVLTVVGEGNEELNNSEYVNVKAVKEDNSTVLTLTSTVKTQAVATATDEQDGLATALDVKTYVDNAVSTASHVHVTQDFVVSDTETSQFTLDAAPYTGFEVVVYQNGIALVKDEYTVSGSTVTLIMIPDVSVALEAGDVIKVSYFTTNPPTNA